MTIKRRFIDNSNKKHNNKYNYDDVVYKDTNTMIIIICPIHGKFEQKPKNHTRGSGCYKCATEARTNSSRANAISRVGNTAEFIKEAIAVHGDLYDYRNVKYMKSYIPVDIVCNRCFKTFSQTPSNHKQGQGCRGCNKTQAPLTTLQFIKDARDTHGIFYNYSLVNYKHGESKVIIICPLHGEFSQVPNTHKAGSGCPKCGEINKRKHVHNVPTSLYYIKVTYKDISAYKIGVTIRTLKERFKKDLSDSNFTIEVLKIWEYDTGLEAYTKEQEILGKYIANNTYKGDIELLFDGNSELFDNDVLGLEV